MSPDHLAAAAALIKIIEAMNGWHIGTILLVIIIGPWLLALVLSYLQTKRFESVVKMYESNVRLVEGYESISVDLREVVIMNTQAMTRACDAINQNQFCPMVRIENQKIMRRD